MGFNDLLSRLAADKSLKLNQSQIKQYAVYKDLLLSWNNKVNLTAITDETEIAEKHFLDCLVILPLLSTMGVRSIVDIGGGNGFPGVVIKIACPDIELCVVEAMSKKAGFLCHLINSLSLQGISIINDRVENMASSYRSYFDLALARAVSSLSVLTEYSLPLLKLGGRGIFWKGKLDHQEILDGKKSLAILGGRLENIESYSLPHQSGQRQLIIVSKVRETPDKFPRKPGKPEKRPAHLLPIRDSLKQ